MKCKKKMYVECTIFIFQEISESFESHVKIEIKFCFQKSVKIQI